MYKDVLRDIELYREHLAAEHPVDAFKEAVIQTKGRGSSKNSSHTVSFSRGAGQSQSVRSSSDFRTSSLSTSVWPRPLGSLSSLARFSSISQPRRLALSLVAGALFIASVTPSVFHLMAHPTVFGIGSCSIRSPLSPSPRFR